MVRKRDTAVNNGLQAKVNENGMKKHFFVEKHEITLGKSGVIKTGKRM